MKSITKRVFRLNLKSKTPVQGNLPQLNLPECATRKVIEGETRQTNAACFSSPHAHAKQIFKSFPNSKQFKKILEVGGSISQNAKDIFSDLEYYNLDLIENQDLPTIVGDITQGIDLESESFDFIFSNNTFEHINQPWLAAKEITRLLKVGGLCYISTVWSWRYHPVPIDYWRFSPDCLEFIFQDLVKIEANFNLFQRRRDDRGFWPNKLDSVPVDNLGGWKENWSVYYVGMKEKK